MVILEKTRDILDNVPKIRLLFKHVMMMRMIPSECCALISLYESIFFSQIQHFKVILSFKRILYNLLINQYIIF